MVCVSKSSTAVDGHDGAPRSSDRLQRHRSFTPAVSPPGTRPAASRFLFGVARGIAVASRRAGHAAAPPPIAGTPAIPIPSGRAAAESLTLENAPTALAACPSHLTALGLQETVRDLARPPGMATIKGFTIIFVSGTRIRQVTMATTDERFIERQLECPRSCPAHRQMPRPLGFST